MSNLLSGTIGAVVGGILAILASVIATAQQRTQARQQASYAAAAEILLNILKIKQGMWDVKESPVDKRDLALKEVYDAAERIKVVHNIVLAKKEIRQRVRDLLDLVDIWYENNWEHPGQTVDQECNNRIASSMNFVRASIAAYLDNEPLPLRPPPAEPPLSPNPGSSPSSTGAAT